VISVHSLNNLDVRESLGQG